MSIKLMSAIWEKGPTDSTGRFILLTLANYANDNGVGVYPSYATIAKRCAITRRTAIRAVESLVEQGYLIRRRRTKDGRFTSSEYKINTSKLLDDSDTTSPQDDLVVTHDHQGSDTVSPEWCQDVTRVVTHDHQGSDTVSPNPLIDPLSDPSMKGERTHARETGPQADVPESPLPLPSKQSKHRPKPSPEIQTIGDMANAITETTGVSAKVNKLLVFDFSTDLVEAGYTPEQLRTHFGRDDPGPDRWWYYRDDWRGRTTDKRTSEPPTLAVIRERVALATTPAGSGQPAQRELTIMEKIKLATGIGQTGPTTTGE